MKHSELLQEMDALQNTLSELLTSHPDLVRQLTQEHFEERVAHYFAKGKKEVEALGPEDDNDRSGFRPMATVFAPHGAEGDICVGWHDGHKRDMMHALSDTCKTLLSQGVIFRNVYTGANMYKIAEAMEYSVPDPHDHQKMRYFEGKMWKWIEKNYGSQRLAALPAEMRFDGLITAGMGPKLHEYGRTATYQWKNGVIEWQDAPPEGECRITLIPKWWQ